jgi:hypothetical protein
MVNKNFAPASDIKLDLRIGDGKVCPKNGPCPCLAPCDRFLEIDRQDFSHFPDYEPNIDQSDLAFVEAVFLEHRSA